MMPAPPRRAHPRRLTRGVPAACLRVLLLVTFFVPARDPVTRHLAIEWRPLADLAVLVLVVAIVALARPQFVARRGVAIGLAVFVAAAAFLNLVDAAAPALLGRDLNLYWDLRHMPSLAGLVGGSAGSWNLWLLVASGVGATLLAIAGA